MKLAPIVLFVYNRPDHTLRTLEALSKNDLADQSTLYIYSDGPKINMNESEIAPIRTVRELIRLRSWCKEVIIIEQKFNKGLANSIIHGVTSIVNEHSKVIVLEDDILPHRGFLKYMNDALEIYENNEKVMHISAYIYPLDVSADTQTFFLKILSCWGWATWARAWKYYNHNIDEHLAHFSKPEYIRQFNINGHADYYNQLLLNKSKKIYSWAVRWYASWLYENGLALYPAISLTENIGYDGSGVHYSEPDYTFKTPTTDFIKVEKIEKIEENTIVRESIGRFYKNRFGMPEKIPNSHLLKKRIFKVFLIDRLKIYFKKIKSIWYFPYHLYPKGKYVDEIISFSKISSKAALYPPYRISHSNIGNYTYIAEKSIVNKANIGKFCSIGPNFICGWGIHPINGISTSPMFYSVLKQTGTTYSDYNKAVEFRRINIGHDVYIGMNVTILDGVEIGNGAVIGAGAVVTKNVPPYAIAAGNPAKVIKYRFSKDEIDALQEIKWWDFPIEKLKEVEIYFSDVPVFIKKHRHK